MDYKAGARFQPKLNRRMPEEIHVNQEITSDQAEIITQIFILSCVRAVASVSDYLENSPS
jgi:hypothetical protein